jgi:hypothetical protein
MLGALLLRRKWLQAVWEDPDSPTHVPSTAAKQLTAALQNPYEEFVTLQFSRLRYVCRFEKGGYCKETKKNCAPQICPQIRE